MRRRDDGGRAVEMRAGGMMPRLRQRLFMDPQRWGGMYWRKEGVRDLSSASLGSMKLKGPWRRMSGSARLSVSAQAIYLVGSGVVVGWNSMRSRYSIMPSGAVR